MDLDSRTFLLEAVKNRGKQEVEGGADIEGDLAGEGAGMVGVVLDVVDGFDGFFG